MTPPLPKNWHEKECAVYTDPNVLMLGVPQAQVLLNTLRIEGYPDKLSEAFNNLKVPVALERVAQQTVLNSCLFDAEQEKLPLIKDPLRPAHTFARAYGVTAARKW